MSWKIGAQNTASHFKYKPDHGLIEHLLTVSYGKVSSVILMDFYGSHNGFFNHLVKSCCIQLKCIQKI